VTNKIVGTLLDRKEGIIYEYTLDKDVLANLFALTTTSSYWKNASFDIFADHPQLPHIVASLPSTPLAMTTRNNNHPIRTTSTESIPIWTQPSEDQSSLSSSNRIQKSPLYVTPPSTFGHSFSLLKQSQNLNKSSESTPELSRKVSEPEEMDKIGAINSKEALIHSTTLSQMHVQALHMAIMQLKDTILVSRVRYST
jgi:hypothetical protein